MRLIINANPDLDIDHSTCRAHKGRMKVNIEISMSIDDWPSINFEIGLVSIMPSAFKIIYL